jgi:hypothetical protein
MKTSGMLIRYATVASLVTAAASVFAQSESVSCGSNIVSATVVATYCGHRTGGEELLDLMILWRGEPGWFHRRTTASGGGGGSTTTAGGGRRGRVYEYRTYGDVTISFDADFDANTLKIGDVVQPLEGINTVLVDFVDQPDARRILATRSVEPRLPLVGDMNLLVIQRSRELRDYLQCDIPMPAPPLTRFPMRAIPVVTVCEKLKPR